MTRSENRKLIKWSSILLAGLLLFAGIAFQASGRRQQFVFYDSDLFAVGIAGEGLDRLSQTDLHINFDDSGNIDLLFQTEDESRDMILWAFVFGDHPYSWETDGDISSVTFHEEEECQYSDVKEGENAGLSAFRIKISSSNNGRIHLRLDPEHVIQKTKYVSRLQTPSVIALAPAIEQHPDVINPMLELLDSVSMSQMSEEEQSEFFDEVFQLSMNTGKIGEIYLSPAKVNITAVFHDSYDANGRKRYEWKVRPENYTRDLTGIQWEPMTDAFYTTMECQNTGAWESAEKITNLLYTVDTFFITTAAIEIIKLLYQKWDSRKKHGI